MKRDDLPKLQLERASGGRSTSGHWDVRGTSYAVMNESLMARRAGANVRNSGWLLLASSGSSDTLKAADDRLRAHGLAGQRFGTRQDALDALRLMLHTDNAL